MANISQDLRELYETRCLMEGEPFHLFIEAVVSDWEVVELLALVDDVETAMLENMRLMIDANPALELTGEARAVSLREDMQRLRERLQG